MNSLVDYTPLQGREINTWYDNLHIVGFSKNIHQMEEEESTKKTEKKKKDRNARRIMMVHCHGR